MPTVEEFKEILGCPLGGRKPYLFLGFYPSLARISQIVKISIQELDHGKQVENGVVGVPRKCLEAKARTLASQDEWAPLMDILALLIFGVVLFPNVDGTNTGVLQRVHKAWERVQKKDEKLRGSSNGPIGDYRRWLKAYAQGLDWLPNLRTTKEVEGKASKEDEEDELKACLRSKRSLSQWLCETKKNMLAIISKYKEELNLATAHEHKVADEYARVYTEKEARGRVIDSLHQEATMKDAITKRAPRHPYCTRSKSRTMGDLEEVQEQMKVDMSALKEQMASMMEAMLGMKQLMESSAATVAAASTTTEVDPALSTAAHHPVPNMMGQERSTLGHISNPHLGYNRGAYPYGLPPNYTPPAMHEDVDHVPPSSSKGSLLGILTWSTRILESTLRETSTPTPRFPLRGRCPTHYLNPTSRESLETTQCNQCASGRRTGTAGAKKKEGDAHTVTSTPAWPKPPQTPHGTHQYAQHHPSFSACSGGTSNTVLTQPRAPTPPQGGAPRAPTPTQPHSANNAHLGAGPNTARNFSPRQVQIFTPIPMTYGELLPSLIANQLAVVIPGRVLQPPFPKWEAVNAIKVSRSHGPKLLKDVTTSRRFIFNALQKAGVIPRGEHKKDSCLMHSGVLHDMETCSASADKEGPERPKPLVIHFTRDTAPQRPRHPSVVSGVRPILFPYKNSHAVSWRYAPPGGMKEEATDVHSLSVKVTNITGLSGITRSGRVFAPPGLSMQPTNAKGKTNVTEGQNVKVIPAPDEEANVRKNISERKNKGQGSRSGQHAKEVPPCHISRSFVSAGLRREGQVAAICDEDSPRRSNLVQPCPPGF
ncbi:hypothetical protein GmHk_19G054509 [Glycine max]|nr:hypothetical protein GmHk_19G054509 [Glycine max]